MFIRLLSGAESVKSSAGIRTIKTVRRLLVNTPVNDWKSTGLIREWIYKRTNAAGVAEVEYFGVKLRVPAHDMGLAPGLIGGYYEKLQLSIFEQLAINSETIVDVGANIGLYTALGAKSMKKQGNIISFEPIPGNIELLKENIKLNSLSSKVKIAAYAAGEDDRKLELYISQKSVGNHSAGGAGARDYGGMLEVQQTSIDNYLKKKSVKKVDLIKIDVEGYDGYVLKGALKTIADSHPALMIECIPKLLDRCKFSHQEFGRMLFDNYKYCYSIDEANGIVVRIEQANFEHFLGKLNDANLVLVQRPDHRKIVEKFVK